MYRWFKPILVLLLSLISNSIPLFRKVRWTAGLAKAGKNKKAKRMENTQKMKKYLLHGSLFNLEETYQENIRPNREEIKPKNPIFRF